MANKTNTDIYNAIRRLGNCMSSTSSSSDEVSIDNKHYEILGISSQTFSGVKNYSYSVLAGSATVTINGVTISGIPTGFDARQGGTRVNQLNNDVTITGDSVDSRIIVYYEE